MAFMTLQQVLAATRGQLLLNGPLAQFSRIITNSRDVEPGDLFVALHGEQHNGHEFLADARARGAAGALVDEALPGVRSRHTEPGAWSIIEVTDTLYALGQLAAFHRSRFCLPVIGITGSAGKTTTKEMTAAILETSLNVLKSKGNFNNEIGLPLTLFQLTAAHQAAVLEFGMRGRGQISYLTALAHPTIGVITNIGLTHLELLGSPEEIALAKAELLDGMSETAVAVLPKSDGFFPLLRAHARGPIVTVGETTDCDYWVSDVALGEDGGARFTLHIAETALPITLMAPGRHQVWNALAAAAAALTAGVTLEAVQEGLAGYRPAEGRMHVRRTPDGVVVVDDTYNANPTAMRATLEFLAEMPGRRKVAVLGDMRELGPQEQALHREIGAYAMAQGIDALIAIGELGREYVTGAGCDRAQWCSDTDTAVTAVRAMLHPGDVVLVKGSRVMHMEAIVNALIAE